MPELPEPFWARPGVVVAVVAEVREVGEPSELVVVMMVVCVSTMGEAEDDEVEVGALVALVLDVVVGGSVVVAGFVPDAVDVPEVAEGEGESVVVVASAPSFAALELASLPPPRSPGMLRPAWMLGSPSSPLFSNFSIRAFGVSHIPLATDTTEHATRTSSTTLCGYMAKCVML